MIRVILADDHTILRDKLQELLAQVPDLEIVGKASNGLLLLEVLEETPADVVLLDVNMPAMSGLTATPLIRQRFPAVKVLVLSMLDHERYVSQMFAAGASGYVLKNASLAEIIYAIRTVSQHKPFLSTEIGLRVIDKLVYGVGITSQTAPHSKPTNYQLGYA